MAKSNRPPLADYADREVTAKTRHFADWLHDKTGAEVDPMTAQLALALDKPYRASDEYAGLVEDTKRARDEAEQARKDAIVAKRRESAQRKLDEARAALEALGGGEPVDEVSAKRTEKAATKAPAKKATRPAAKNASKAPAKKAPAKAAKKTSAPPAGAGDPAGAIDDDF